MADQLQRKLLPFLARPDRYLLRFEPDFEAAAFRGNVKIECRILQATNLLVLHSKYLDVNEAFVVYQDKRLSCQSIGYDEDDETVKLTFEKQLLAEEVISLEISYTGKFENNFEGLYQTEYTTEDGETHKVAATALEPTYARQALPCFDEPHLKAKFVVSAVVDASFEAFSNMPASGTEALSESKKLVVFEETPVMSTYLLAFMAGHLAQVRSQDSRVPISVICQRGREDDAGFSVDLASKGLRFFEDLFGSPYPLPKLDLAAVPECAAGGQENWGLIMFKEMNVLLDCNDSALDRKRVVVETVLHEIAHMWFGNLVTMEVWDGLWLKEGFATLMCWIAVENFFPDWHIWDRYVAVTLQTALGLDSLRSSHPVERFVPDPKKVKQMYDEISYQKGCCVLKMVSSEFGVEKFVQGVKLYIQRYQFGCTRSEDLWTVLEEVLQAPIRERMDIWTKKVGFPRIQVLEEIAPNQNGEDRLVALRLIQSRFSGEVAEEQDNQIYPVRVTIRFSTGEKSFDMVEEQTVIPVPTGSRWAKVNANHDGFFVTGYTSAHLNKLLEAAVNSELTVRDCIGLSCDLKRLVVAGINKTSDLLDLIHHFRVVESYLVWETIDSHLRALGEAFKFKSPALEFAIQKLAAELFGDMAISKGWDISEGDDTSVLFKTMLFSNAGLAGNESVISAARDMFERRVGGDEQAIPPSLRWEVFGIVVAHGGSEEVEHVLNIWLTSTNEDEKYLALECLGRTRNPNLIQRVLGLAFTGQVGPEDLFIMLWLIGSHANGAIEIWEWAKQNWKKLIDSVPSTLRSDTIKLVFQGLNTSQQIADVRSFFASQDTSEFDVMLARKLEEMEGTRRWAERDAIDVLEWFKKHGYAGDQE
ncbi:aminopeptidase 2 [Naviculisporaceae sp. PSN 640]